MPKDRPLRPDDKIAERLREASDRPYYDALHSDVCYAFGEPGSLPSGGADEHPDYPATFLTRIKAGKSRRIMKSAFVHLSKIASGRTEPSFTQVDKWTGEIRKQFYIERTTGGQGHLFGIEGFNEENAAMFLDGDQLGVGFKQWMFMRNPGTGKMFAYGIHRPATQVLWDPFARHPGRARYWAPVIYVPEDEALRRWGAKAEGYIQTYMDPLTQRGLRALKVYWYEDVGDDDYAPSWSIIPKSFGEKPFEKKENPTGRLNGSYHYHWVAPGMRRPVGRIPLQTATQEVLNIMEARMLKTLKRPDVDVLDFSVIDQKDYNLYLQGRRDFLTARAGDPSKAAHRLPGAILGAEFPVLHDWYENEYRGDSGTADYDFGAKPEGVNTLGEANLLDTRAQITNVWSRMQYLASQIRDVYMLLECAKVGDRDPLTLDIFGYNVPINDPSNPDSWIDNFLQEPSRIIIDEAALDTNLRDAKRAQRVAGLQAIAPLQATAGGPIDPIWFAEQMLEAAVGLTDPKEAFIPGVMGGQQGAAGAPLQPGVPPMDQLPEGQAPNALAPTQAPAAPAAP